VVPKGVFTRLTGKKLINCCRPAPAPAKPTTTQPIQPIQPTPQKSKDKSELDIDGLLDEIGTFTPPPQRRESEKKTTPTTSTLSVNIPKTKTKDESTTPNGSVKHRYIITFSFSFTSSFSVINLIKLYQIVDVSLLA
jgi:hypothetical protein